MSPQCSIDNIDSELSQCGSSSDFSIDNLSDLCTPSEHELEHVDFSNSKPIQFADINASKESPLFHKHKHRFSGDLASPRSSAPFRSNSSWFCPSKSKEIGTLYYIHHSLSSPSLRPSQIQVFYPKTSKDSLILWVPAEDEFEELLWTCNVKGLIEKHRLTSANNAILVLDQRILRSQDLLHFSLQVFNSNGSVSDFNVNITSVRSSSLPSNFDVTPSKGTSSVTEFHLTHSNSSPDVLFDWCVVRKHWCFPLVTPSPNPQLETFLPHGYSEDMVTIICRKWTSSGISIDGTVSLKIRPASFTVTQRRAFVSPLELINSHDSIVPTLFALSKTIHHHLSKFNNDTLFKMRNRLFSLLVEHSNHPLFLDVVSSCLSITSDIDIEFESPTLYLDLVRSLLSISDQSTLNF
ncbi:hypothetical protein GEMRC1_007223 [Eukaryota sp. GEM-RC1]